MDPWMMMLQLDNFDDLNSVQLCFLYTRSCRGFQCNSMVGKGVALASLLKAVMGRL